MKKRMEREGRKPNEQIANERLVRSFRERHFIFSDRQIPDQDPHIEGLLLQLIKDYRPTHIWENGDIINATTVSSFGSPADYHISLAEELEQAKGVIKRMTKVAREANPDVQITFLLGNHERRLQKYIDKNAPELAEIVKGDERVLTIPYLLDLKEQGIKWVDYWAEDKIGKETVIFHGDLVSQKSGVTAHRNIDRFGKNVISGHTHRLALVFRTQSDEVKFGMETGSLCKKTMKVPYSRKPDWQNGFGFLGVDRDGKLHPTVIPIVDGRFTFGGKIYK